MRRVVMISVMVRKGRRVVGGEMDPRRSSPSYCLILLGLLLVLVNEVLYRTVVIIRVILSYILESKETL